MNARNEYHYIYYWVVLNNTKSAKGKNRQSCNTAEAQTKQIAKTLIFPSKKSRI